MKTKIKTYRFIIAILAFITLAAGAFAQENSVWAGGGTDQGATNCYAIVSAYSKNNGQPVVTYLNVTSDKAGSLLKFYDITNAPVGITGANSTTSVPVVRTNGFGNGDIAVIWHKNGDIYERVALTTFTTNNTVILTAAPIYATASGDQLFRCVQAGYIPVGATNVIASGSGIYSGRRGKPLLMELDGTSAVQVNAAAASYVP